MKLGEVVRFETRYQLERPWTWLYFAILVVLTFQITTQVYTGNARTVGYFYNSPFVILSMTVLATLMSLVAVAGVAGDAGGRDIQTRMHPLLYTSSLSEGTYLRGRFLAAFVVAAIVLLAVPLGLLLSLLPGIPADLLGPFQLSVYAESYLVIALPDAFIATALLYSAAVLGRRAIAAFIAAIGLFSLTLLVFVLVAAKLGRWDVARLLDPLGLTLLGEISRSTTVAEKNALSLLSNPAVLVNRLLWIGIAVGVLGFTGLRFRFAQPATRGRRLRKGDRVAASETRDLASARAAPIVAPPMYQAFGRATRVRQVLAVTAQSFREIALGWGGLILGGFSVLLVILGPSAMAHLGVPMIPTTAELSAFAGNTGELLWMIVPILTAFYVGELVWRDRETGLSEIADAAPVPDWVRLVGRYLGFALLFVAYESLLVAACLLVQLQLGYRDFELGLYARIFFGLQLPEHLLFAMLAFLVHVTVNQKYVGHLILVAVVAFTAFAPSFGIEHHLLAYGAAPAWGYSDLRGFAGSVAPWLWFKLYWTAIALLLAVTAKLFWVRGRENALRTRMRLARQRLTVPTRRVAAFGATLALGAGGFVFYNTSILNSFVTARQKVERQLRYEEQYGRFARTPQPTVTGITLKIELHSDRGEAEVTGAYRLVNRSGRAIDSIHLAPSWRVETGAAVFNRPAALALDDDQRGHRIYRLSSPLAPGDSLGLRFSLQFRTRGFTNDGVDPSVTRNGTFFDARDWIPAIGYQHSREIENAGERFARGLPPRPGVRSLDDIEARNEMGHAERIEFSAVVGTAEGQMAVASGVLRRTWTEKGRRYFHYTSDAPIRNDFAILSAAYAVTSATWTPVAVAGRPVLVEVIHHPAHAAAAERLLRSAEASLAYYSRTFGPYPAGGLRLVEYPGSSISAHASPFNVRYTEGFAMLNPDADPRGFDFQFAVMAHEVAHQWWGNQVTPADVEGSVLLTEVLAWYSAMGVVEEVHGAAHLARLLSMMRETYLDPRSRAGVPLLRAVDTYRGYRIGPFAMYALREYLGEKQVGVALRRMVARYGAGTPPLPTSRDLFRELQEVTPDSLRYLLTDLFETNTYWDLSARRVIAEPAGDGTWRVTLDVAARKATVDTAGIERELPMNDLVEIGVFGKGTEGEATPPLYLRLQRVTSGVQRIVVTVPGEPDMAGIDPRNLLIDVKPGNNRLVVTR